MKFTTKYLRGDVAIQGHEYRRDGYVHIEQVVRWVNESHRHNYPEVEKQHIFADMLRDAKGRFQCWVIPNGKIR
jgi:RNA:NAD 2'-phosphotransferase (TPT1/KptA family)